MGGGWGRRGVIVSLSEDCARCCLEEGSNFVQPCHPQRVRGALVHPALPRRLVPLQHFRKLVPQRRRRLAPQGRRRLVPRAGAPMVVRFATCLQQELASVEAQYEAECPERPHRAKSGGQNACRTARL